jgi:mRNA interferase RelE/StbE
VAYAVAVTRRAQRQLDRSPAELRARFEAAIDRLATDPRHRGVAALTGGGFLRKYRVRVGDHRVVFEIDDGQKIVYIMRIGRRDSIYPDSRGA